MGSEPATSISSSTCRVHLLGVLSLGAQKRRVVTAGAEGSDECSRARRRQVSRLGRGVEDRGLEEVRKIAGYHDEPLKGALKGLRSIRLSKGYRAYYKIVKDRVEFIRVERVDKHVY